MLPELITADASGTTTRGSSWSRRWRCSIPVRATMEDGEQAMALRRSETQHDQQTPTQHKLKLTGVSGLDRYAYACMRGDGTRLGVVPRVWPMSWGLLGSQ